MNVALVQQLSPNRLARAALKQNVVGYHDRRASVNVKDCVDVLEKIELLVTRRSPEVIAHNNEALFLLVTLFVDHGDAALLPERRIG